MAKPQKDSQDPAASKETYLGHLAARIGLVQCRDCGHTGMLGIVALKLCCKKCHSTRWVLLTSPVSS